MTDLREVGSGFTGQVQPLPLTDHAIRMRWAQDAVETMLTLWLAPQHTLSGGYPPDGTVMPTPP